MENWGWFSVKEGKCVYAKEKEVKIRNYSVALFYIFL